MKVKKGNINIGYTPFQFGDEATENAFITEEDESSTEYLLMSQQRELPALQEYLHEVHAHDSSALP